MLKEIEKKAKIKINLGCGADIRKGWINVDKIPVENFQKRFDMHDISGWQHVCEETKYIQYDLNEIPYPFPENYADLILLSHVLEHLYIPPYEVMKEIHRILKPKGKLIVKLPISRNIVTHLIPKFNIYYFNPILVNPVGEFFEREYTSLQREGMFKLLYVEKIRNFQRILFHKNNRVKFKGKKSNMDLIVFFKHLPHRLYDLIVNGEIIWVMEAIK